MRKQVIASLFIGCGLLFSTALFAQDKDVVAGIPVNYDESKTGDYKLTLPDPLVMLNGKEVTTAKQWYNKRRPELIKLFEENQYGKWPDKKPKLRYTLQEDTGFEGTAIRKQVTIYFSDNDEGPKVDVLIYLPKDANGPVPLLLNLSFMANDFSVSDPGIKPGLNWDPTTKTSRVVAANNTMGGAFSLNNYIKTFLKEGFGFATLHYTDIDPDFLGGVTLGVRGLYLKPGQTEPAPDEWGSISAWAWGVSNVMDYFEIDPSIDAKRIAITGASRLGKTVMWT